MFTIFKEFETFIGEDKGKYRKTIALSVLESLFQVGKIIAMYMVIKAIMSNSLNKSTILYATLIMFAGILVAIYLKAKTSMAQTEVGYGVAAHKRIEIGDHLKYVPMGFFSKKSLGQISSVATNNCNSVQETATIVMMQFTSGLANGLIITLLLLNFNLKIGLVSVLALIIFFLILGIINKRSEKVSADKVKCDTTLVEKTLEYVQGMQIVKSFNLKDNRDSEYMQEIDKNKKVNTRLETTFLPIIFLQTLVTRTLAVVIIYLSISEYIAGNMPVYDAVMMLIVSYMLFTHLESAGAFVNMFKLLKFSMDTINEVGEMPVMDIDGKNIVPEQRNIEFKNVDFSYDKRKILENVNLQIEENTTTAIVGPSGSGKTTITNLIARFWDVDSGEISLGGQNIKDYKLDALWDNISVVFQDVYLFNDTIENNIKFGSPDATREEVVEAAKKAHCYEFIMNFEDGFDTIIGEGGSSLSGGEAQRISIARAIMKDAPIIIFDEATANVDPENEKAIQEAIKALTNKKTVIMIAHRLKTVMNADQIIVVKDGKIEASGKHEELMQKGGTYRDFVNMREHTIGWKLEQKVS
ncbi:MAG: ABC transporter ATP-binding protein [Eubacteriales bacterium]|nr:ABC transporter ATP-binding protein [Eubacteriales bacterium]